MLRTLSIFVLLLTSSFAKAAFQIETAVYVNPNVVQAMACNNAFAAPIICNTTAFGMLPNGLYLKTWTQLYLRPGQCDYAYVYANSGYYFVGGYSTAFCEFAAY